MLLTGYIPNGIEAIEAMLAAASIGAIWSSTSPDFGITVWQILQRCNTDFKFNSFSCWVETIRFQEEPQVFQVSRMKDLQRIGEAL